MTAQPYLSVVIPVLNRERLVLRAIASVLAHPSRDIEIIVVDDASTDGTAKSVASIGDPRLHLIRLPENVGRCSARNSAAGQASGEWLVFLDSDDELVPGALDIVRERARNAAPAVRKLLFACCDDLGILSPRPALDGRTVDYTGYLRWLEETSGGASEALPCTRRSDFLECPYPEMPYWHEGIHELDFVRCRRVQLCPEVVRLYHLDAPNRVSVPNVSELIDWAHGTAGHAETVLARHGTELWRYAKTRWISFAREAALHSFLAGDRRKGMRHSFAVLRRVPVSIRPWVVLLAGLLGVQALARLKSMQFATPVES